MYLLRNNSNNKSLTYLEDLFAKILHREIRFPYGVL